MTMKITKIRDEWYNEYMDYRLSFKYKKPANDFVRCFLNWCDRTYPIGMLSYIHLGTIMLSRIYFRGNIQDMISI